MGSTGRPSLLTPERLEQVREAYALGLSEEDAAEACGISRGTWFSWKAQGRKAQATFAEKPPAERTVAELRELLRELGVNPDSVAPGGRRGKPSKADYVAAVEERAAPFLNFLDRLEQARPAAKLSLLRTARALADGGIRVTETKVVTKVLATKLEDGAVVPVGEPVVVETATTTKETLPSWVATRTLLERRWPEDMGPKKAQDPTPTTTEADRERERQELALNMRASVPAAPVLKPVDAMSIEELEAELAAAGSGTT